MVFLFSNCDIQAGFHLIVERLISIKDKHSCSELGLHDFMHDFNPGQHVVVSIAGRVCDNALKRELKLITYQFEIFLVKDQCLRSLQQYEDNF